MPAPAPLDHLSVVIPAYNAALYIAEAIASAQRQPLPQIQVIVVDDGSTDDTRRIVEAIPGVLCVSQPNAGAGAARNAGIHLARAPWLAFLDADDFWTPDKISRQYAWLAAHGTDMVFGHVEEFLSANAPAGMVVRPPQPSRLPGTLLIGREAFLRAGLFDPRWRTGELIDWYARATERGLTASMLPEVVLHRRLHADNHGRRLGSAAIDYVRILKGALDRRRANAPPGGPPGD